MSYCRLQQSAKSTWESTPVTASLLFSETPPG